MATQTDEKTKTEEESPATPSSPFILKGRITTPNGEEVGQMKIIIRNVDGSFVRSYNVPGSGIFEIPLDPKGYEVSIQDPVGRYHKIDFGSSPTDVGEIILSEIPPEQRKAINIDFSGSGGGGKTPIEIEKTNQYIQQTLDGQNITVENDFDKHIDDLDVEELSKKYNLTPEQKTEIQSKIVHLKSEQQKALETVRKNAISRFIPRQKDVIKLDTSTLSEELQDRITKVQNTQKAQKGTLVLKEKFDLDEAESESVQKRLENIYGQRDQFAKGFEKQLKDGKITQEEFDRRMASTIPSHFPIHSETFDSSLDKKIQTKFSQESAEKQDEITKKAKEALENRDKKARDEQEQEKIRASIRKSIAEREKRQRDDQERQAVQDISGSLQEEEISRSRLQRESPSSYRLRNQPSRPVAESMPSMRPSPPNMFSRFPRMFPRLGGLGNMFGGAKYASFIGRAAPLLTNPVFWIIVGIIFLVAVIVVIFFKPTGEVPQDIAYCKFYKTRLVEGSLKPVSVALGSASGKALIDAMSPIVNATTVPAPLIFALMRVDREEAFHASIDYAIADYDNAQDREIKYDLTSEYGIGIMQIAPSQFEDIFNDPTYKGIFSSLGKTSFNKVIELQESPPPNDSEDLAKRSVLRIASIKDNTLAATVRMRRFRDIAFPNPDQEWNEEVVRKVAELYRGNCFYNNVDGAQGNYCDDVWKGYSECQLRLGQETLTPNTPIPGLTISKSGPTTANVGETVTYALTAVYSQDDDVIIVEPIPANTTFVSASPGFRQEGNNIQWRLKELQATINPSTPNVKTYTFQLQVKIIADPITGNDFYVTNTAFGRLIGSPTGGTGETTEFSTLMSGQGRNVRILGDENNFVSTILRNRGGLPLGDKESQLRQIYQRATARNVNPLAVLVIWGVEQSFKLGSAGHNTEFGCMPFGNGFSEQLLCSVGTFDNWMKDFERRGGPITLVGVQTCTFTDAFVYAYEKYTPVCTINHGNDGARTRFVSFYKQLGGF